MNSRWRTLAMDLTNVSVGTNGTVGSFNPESGKYLIHWSTGSSGYYDADSLES